MTASRSLRWNASVKRRVRSISFAHSSGSLAHADAAAAEAEVQAHAQGTGARQGIFLNFWRYLVRLISGISEDADYAPAMVISAILIVGEAVEDRHTRSFPIISIELNMSLRFPATVTSCTG